MQNYYYIQFVSYLPLIFLFVFTFLKRKRGYSASIPFYWIVFLEFFLILYIAFYPPELTPDKMDYAERFVWISQMTGPSEYKDGGWLIYMRFCHWLTSGNLILFFTITASIYVLSYLLFARTYFPPQSLGYFIVMVAGCLGFFNYGTNVIRNGIAIAILLIALSLKNKTVYKVVLLIIAMSFHKSVFIPIFAFAAAFFVKKEKYALMVWIICLLFSIANFDLEPVFESFGFIDKRIESYGASIANESSYEKGFRIDFLIYSTIPILLVWYYKRMKLKVTKLYWHICRSYLLTNSVWLLAIRIAYSDRLAYLSWFMIPFITLFPVVYEPKRFRNPQLLILIIMYIFMGVSVALGIRSMLRN